MNRSSFILFTFSDLAFHCDVVCVWMCIKYFCVYFRLDCHSSVRMQYAITISNFTTITKVQRKIKEKLTAAMMIMTMMVMMMTFRFSGTWSK